MFSGGIKETSGMIWAREYIIEMLLGSLIKEATKTEYFSGTGASALFSPHICKNILDKMFLHSPQTYFMPPVSKLNSHLSKKFFYLRQWYPFKNDEKYFLFHLKSSFRSQDI